MEKKATAFNKQNPTNGGVEETKNKTILAKGRERGEGSYRGKKKEEGNGGVCWGGGRTCLQGHMNQKPETWSATSYPRTGGGGGGGGGDKWRPEIQLGCKKTGTVGKRAKWLPRKKKGKSWGPGLNVPKSRQHVTVPAGKGEAYNNPGGSWLQTGQKKETREEGRIESAKRRKKKCHQRVVLTKSPNEGGGGTKRRQS